MMEIRGVKLDFDISCPEDLQRYLRCNDEMAQKEQVAPPMPPKVETPDEQKAYVEWVTAMCRILTDWIDGVFGDGASNALLGPKTSLREILALCDELRAASEAQGKEISQRVQSFAPNRRTRRDGK